MIINVQGQNLQVPDGLSQPQIGEVVDHFVSTRMALVAQQSPLAMAAAPQVAPASPASPPQAPPNPQTPTDNDYTNDAEKMAENAANGATLGMADNIGAAISKPIVYAAKNVLPKSMGGEDVSYGQVSDSIDATKAKNLSDLQAWNENNEGKALASQIAGGAAIMGPVAELTAAKFPKAISALTAYSKANPLKVASAVGGITGGIYGAGTAQPGDTAEGGAAGAITGAIGGPILKSASDELLSPALNYVGSKAKAGVSALQQFLKSSEAEAPAMAGSQAAAAPPSPTLGFSTINNQPLGAEPPTGPVTGGLPLSPGVRAKDPNILRIEENAKQGLLGQNSQDQMLQSNSRVAQAAADAAQHLKGNTTASAPDLFEGSIQQFQDAGDAAQKQASALYQGPNGLNQSAAMTTLSRSKVAASLGSAMKNTVTDPNEVVNFEYGTVGQGLYKKLQGILSAKPTVTTTSGGTDMYGMPIKNTTVNNELPVNKLLAWRREVSDASRAIIPNSDTHAAGVLGDAFDDWMGSIPQDHVLEGDPDFAAKAQAASQGWAAFKTSFPQRASPFMPGEAKPFDMTPADHAAKLIGQNGTPSATAARQIRGMVAALPTDDAKSQYLNNVFSGAIDLASRGLNGDLSSLPNYRNNLQNFRNSQLFREQYLPLAAKDPIMASKVSIIDKLIPELNQQIQQAGRRDVVSPSGGHTLRGIADMANGLAHNGAGPFVPFLGEGAAIVNKVADMATAGGDRKIFQKSMKAARDSAAKAARSGPVFDVNSLKAGLAGGLASGNVVQQNNGGTQ